MDEIRSEEVTEVTSPPAGSNATPDKETKDNYIYSCMFFHFYVCTLLYSFFICVIFNMHI